MRSIPLTLTTDDDVKPEPYTVPTIHPLPTITRVGDTLVRLGTGFGFGDTLIDGLVAART